MSLLHNIKRLCSKNGITIPGLEANLGFGNGAIYCWDRSSPSIHRVLAVAGYLGVTVQQLVDGEGSSTGNSVELSHVKTADLLNELASRPGVERVFPSLYGSHELLEKYSRTRGPVSADAVLVIRNLDHLDA